LLMRISRGIDIGIFCASLKQIAACDENPEEAVKTILFGAINSKLAALENNFRSAAFISSDKSRASTTIYGSLKFAAGEQFIIKNSYEKRSSTNLSCIIYGNVLNSTGSIIPLMWNAIKNNISLPLYSDEMTRFIITDNEAVDLIYKGLLCDGLSIVPKAISLRVLELFEIYSERFGLDFYRSKPRLGEKIHEILSSSEEIPRMYAHKSNNHFVISPCFGNPSTVTYTASNLPLMDFSSKDHVITKSDLFTLLEKHDFFRP